MHPLAPAARFILGATLTIVLWFVIGGLIGILRYGPWRDFEEAHAQDIAFLGWRWVVKRELAKWLLSSR
jgi:hypothetical protein